MSERIERIEKALGTMLPNCMILHIESVPVVEKFNGQTVWEGIVEAFAIEGDMPEKRVFAWEIPGPKPDYVTVLDRPPVNSAQNAVRAYVASLGRK
jgi:hypothetical protein